MRDAYIQTRPNPWKGRVNDDGQTDERETITEIVLEFLTDHVVEINGDMLPGFVRYKATASTAENSNLRKFLKGWFPNLKDEDFKRFDADKLIGRGAYLTVAHNIGKTGSVWANVVGAMQPPKGADVPVIPQGFVRHQDRPEQATTVPATSPKSATNGDEDDLPF